jgi:glucose-1-phosphate cytidylyltransferase
VKVVILAGGFGTRLGEYTETIPKPMVTVGGRPILWHIMRHYAQYGYKDFVIALGYKAEVVKEYFLNYHTLNSDFSVDLANGQIDLITGSRVDWNVTLVDTGLGTMTGGRVRRLKDVIGEEPFFLTYGDGLADVDVGDLLGFHKEHGKLVTVTAVRPSARFGEIDIQDQQVIDFKEKPNTKEGWINGGYFVVEPSFIDLIAADETVLEKDPLEKAAATGQLMAYKHEGFWQCMDTKRDRDALEDLWQRGEAKWRHE